MENIEQLALETLGSSDSKELSWEQFSSQLQERKEEFNVQIETLEQLDIEAQNVASTFYVR
ncbi:MAG: hypothetical protein C0626_05030 [Arcobacter sp.]|mgnify:CR=1 FL=1|uniref:hypothetical protein n=1 Tax=uncultured Arcobacter sp. TaxID=165434 RepID=UPI000CC728B4|nr:hypothetical protein [uncultured Arcobacter sp.]PLY10350.1 MAG: hypothetical protein C0626_05030 [Arcobacter sp.]